MLDSLSRFLRAASAPEPPASAPAIPSGTVSTVAPDPDPKCAACGEPVRWSQAQLRFTDRSEVVHLGCFTEDMPC